MEKEVGKEKGVRGREGENGQWGGNRKSKEKKNKWGRG